MRFSGPGVFLTGDPRPERSSGLTVPGLDDSGGWLLPAGRISGPDFSSGGLFRRTISRIERFRTGFPGGGISLGRGIAVAVCAAASCPAAERYRSRRICALFCSYGKEETGFCFRGVLRDRPADGGAETRFSGLLCRGCGAGFRGGVARRGVARPDSTAPSRDMLPPCRCC